MKKTKKVSARRDTIAKQTKQIALRRQIDELCERVFQFNVEMAESNLAFTWKGDDLFVLRTYDLGNGYATTEIYQLNEAAQNALAAIDFDIDDDGEVDELFWDCLDEYKLVIFGD
jgi:hypothetical protein